MRDIINAHFPAAPPALIEAAVKRFMVLREKMHKEREVAGKKASTSEFIDWFTVLKRYPLDDALVQLEGRLPFASVLLKSWDDHMRYVTRG